MSITLDAREILMHLNSMGYRNVTAEQLKEFMRGKVYARHSQKTF